MQVYMVETVAWEGKIYPAGQMCDVPDDLAKALNAVEPPGTEDTTPVLPEPGAVKSGRHKKEPETFKPQNINTDV